MTVKHNAIGKKYGPISYEVGVEKIKEFAMAISDLNPVYFKEAEASRSGLKGIAAPPIFAVVFIQKVVNMALNDPELSLDLPMLVHVEQEFEFLDIVYAGDIITTEGKILDIYEKSNMKFVVLETYSTRDGQPVNKGISTFLIRKR